MSERPVSGFQFGRVLRGWWWLLGRDLRAIMPAVLAWFAGGIILRQIDIALGLTPGDAWLSTTQLAEPLFAGMLYVIGLSHDRMTPGVSLGIVLNRYLPLLILSVLSTLGVVAGILFLILPGIALGVLWSIAFPILIVERANPIEALGASFSRLKSVFWPVLGLIAIYFFGMLICGGLTGVFDATEREGRMSLQILDAAFAAVVGGIGVYLNVAIYKELGFTGGHDVSVFD
nr:hypothetical protein [Hyphomonas sp. Mor2]